MLFDPNDPMFTPTDDPNAPRAQQRARILGLLSDPQHAQTLAGAAQGGGLQLSSDAPAAGGHPASPDAFQLPQEAPPDPSVSHIDALMQSGLLTPTQGGQPVGGPPGGGPGGAGAPAAASPAAKPHMIDKIHDWLQSKLGADIPQGMQGLLQKAGVSPDELQASTPGLGANLITKLLTLGMGNTMMPHINNAINLHNTAQTMAGQQGAMGETARIREARQGMATAFPQLPGDATEAQRLNRMQGMSEYLLNHGDLDGAKEMGATARAIWAQPRTPAVNPEWEVRPNQAGTGVNKGKTVTLYLDKRTGLPVPTIGGGTGESVEAPAPKLPKDQMASALTENQRNTTRDKIATEFESYSKAFEAFKQNYDVVKAATSGTPSKASLATALIGFAHIDSPTVRGVGQLVPWMKNNIGTFSDKLERYVNSGLKGQPEPGFLNEVQDMTDRIARQHASTYETARQSYLVRADAAGIHDSNMDKILRPAPAFGKAATPTGTTTGKTAADLRKALQKP